MKKHFALLLMFIAATSSSFAQNKLNKDTSGFAKSPLFILKIQGNDKEYPTLNILGLTSQENIASMEILKDEMADDKYGVAGKNGVIIITLTQGIQIYQLNTLLDKHNIGKKYRKLPLYIDSTLTRNTTSIFYLSTEKIKNITVAKERETGLKYISLLTIDGNAKPAPGLRIRGDRREDM
jgi:hypothetical protein